MLRALLATLLLSAILALGGLVSAPAQAHPAPTSANHAAALAAPSCAATYTVRPGDWLSRIAAAYRTSWQSLAAVNALRNPNLIYPGERLCVPDVSSHAPPPQTPHATYHTAHFADTGMPGECTWYAASRRSDLDLRWAGNAKDWARTAVERGYWVGNTPAVGSVAVFAPGVQGANPQYGHAAIVIAVSGDRFEVAAMAAPYRWVVSESWHTAQAGIQFIYG